jgi:hypothetical protein
MERLREAFNHTMTPMSLHRALNYYLLDFTRLGIAWERSPVVANSLRGLL